MTFARRDGVVVSAMIAQYGSVTVGERGKDIAADTAVLAPGAVGAYVGRYTATRAFRATVEFDVEDLDGQMIVRSSAFPRQPVFPMVGRADRFQYEGGHAELQFERDASGHRGATTEPCRAASSCRWRSTRQRPRPGMTTAC